MEPNNIPEIVIRTANRTDFDFFYSLKSEKTNMYWSGHREQPDFQQLHHWFDQKLACCNERIIYIIEDSGQQVGYIYVDPLDNEHFEIAIGVSEKHSGKHIGSKAIASVVSLYQKSYPEVEFVAWIREDNLASQKAFSKANFKQTNGWKNRWLEPLNQEVKMIKYIWSA